jgi:hypothetical protein
MIVMKTVEFRVNRNEILERMRHADCIVSDFDGTDVKSPLKIAALHYLMNPSHFIDHPKLAVWAAKAPFTRLAKGKDAESALWYDFSSILGKDIRDVVEDVRSGLYKKGKPQEAAMKYVLPGVQEFYTSLPSTEKHYISRNFDAILEVFASALGIDEIHATEDKAHALEEIITSKDHKRYILRGDSHSDDEVLDVAEHYKKKGIIDDYVGVAIGASSHTDNEYVEVVSPPQQMSLVHALRNERDSAFDLINNAYDRFMRNTGYDC